MVFFFATFLKVFFLAVLVFLADLADFAVLAAFFWANEAAAVAGAAMGAGAAAAGAVAIAGVGAAVVAGACANAPAANRPATRTARSFFIYAVSKVNKKGPPENPRSPGGDDSSDHLCGEGSGAKFFSLE